MSPIDKSKFLISKRFKMEESIHLSIHDYATCIRWLQIYITMDLKYKERRKEVKEGYMCKVMRRLKRLFFSFRFRFRFRRRCYSIYCCYEVCSVKSMLTCEICLVASSSRRTQKETKSPNRTESDRSSGSLWVDTDSRLVGVSKRIENISPYRLRTDDRT